MAVMAGGTHTAEARSWKTAPSLRGRTDPFRLFLGPRPPCVRCGAPRSRGPLGSSTAARATSGDLALCSRCRRLKPLRPARSCGRCESSFQPTTGKPMQRFCCRTCAQAAHVDGQRARAAAAVERFEITCAECASPFTVAGRRPHGRRKFCSRECQSRDYYRRRYQTGGYSRRPRNPQGRAKVAVFESAAWHCQLCGAPIDPALKFPHPGSPSLDHIVPLADGGAHEPANWQASHLACNIEKGNAGRRKAAAA